MPEATLEERVATLEAELANLKARTNSDSNERPRIIGRTRPDFLDRFFGIYAGSKMADEVFSQIEAEREAEREAARNAEDDEGNNA